MAIKGAIPCGHGTCRHTSNNVEGHALHGSLHFTASVMGNPDYLKATKHVVQAKDARLEGVERVNMFHATEHEKRTVKQARSWVNRGKP